ncbi:MAG: Gfo/Idh/MocA family oxidoreductase [Burkholderiales bacterium]|nr:Gfo/Idh/MocA family oxidoreductase [Burkholderiales bacterium]
MKKLRVALAGLGVIGRAHLARIAASAECEACAVADPCASAAPEGLPLYRSLAELLDRERPDGVILATPNAAHVEGALECIAAGVPCLVEKPVADTLADARRLAAAVAASGAAVLVGHHRRHSPILQAAAAAIAGGAIGRVVAVMASAVFAKPARYFDEAPWRSRPGGGPILINLVHEIDNLRLLIGDIVEVQALASNAVRGFAVEDTVAINLRFANGALGSFMLSDCAASVRSWEQTSGENKAYDHHGDEDCYLVAGTRGSLALPTLRLLSAEGEASWFEPLAASRIEASPADPLERQFRHFCAMIRGEAPPLVPVAEALKTLEVTLAVAAAAATRQAPTCFTE